MLVTISVTALNSCSLETAKASHDKQLIIVSDYLNSSDTVLFRDFSKSNKVSIQIETMKTDNIIGMFRNEGHNIQADLILMKSLYDVYKLNKRSVLQAIHFESELDEATKKISSIENNFIGLGIDPFIIANSSGRKVRTYNDLLRTNYINNLPEKEVIPLLSPIISKLKKVKANKWVKDFYFNQVKSDTLRDSIGSFLPILTSYSDYSTSEDSLLNFQNRFLTFPNGRSSGTHYNVRTAAIINQAQNYSTAKQFILHFTNLQNNKSLNKKLHTISYLDESHSFKKYTESPDDLIHFYKIAERVINKLD